MRQVQHPTDDIVPALRFDFHMLGQCTHMSGLTIQFHGYITSSESNTTLNDFNM